VGDLVEIIAKIVLPVTAVAIVTVTSIIVLVPQLMNPTLPSSSVLLDETIVLTESWYEKEYHLQFAKGDKLSIRLYGYGQPFDFTILDPNKTIIDEAEITYGVYERLLIVTMDGSYTFYVGADAGNPRVRITITK